MIVFHILGFCYISFELYCHVKWIFIHFSCFCLRTTRYTSSNILVVVVFLVSMSLLDIMYFIYLIRYSFFFFFCVEVDWNWALNSHMEMQQGTCLGVKEIIHKHIPSNALENVFIFLPYIFLLMACTRYRQVNLYQFPWLLDSVRKTHFFKETQSKRLLFSHQFTSTTHNTPTVKEGKLFIFLWSQIWWRLERKYV